MVPESAIVLIVLAGLAAIYVWGSRLGRHRDYTLSKEATAELEKALEEYRGVLAAHPEPVKDINLLPYPKEAMKSFLHVAIGMSLLNRQPVPDDLMERYYRLADFQDIDPDDLAVLKKEKRDAGDAPDRESGGCAGPDSNREEARKAAAVREKYLLRTEAEADTLGDELQVFLEKTGTVKKTRRAVSGRVSG